jgi:signal transduction histidine kinase
MITIVGSVVVALVLAGLGTLLLAELGARRYTESELRLQVEAVAAALEAEDTPLGRLDQRPRLVAALRDALRLEGAELLAITPAGEVRGRVPEGITLDSAALAGLGEGETISGNEGRLVYAAAVAERGASRNRTVVVLSDRTAIALGGSVAWFGLAAFAVIVLAVVIARRLSRRLTDPLRRAEQASRRIAEGDLSARVPEPPAGEHDEVADLSRSINAMAGSLERFRGLEHRFLLSVSHDLRTPLTSIQGYAEALADGTTSDAARAGAVILSESRRLDRLVLDLLDLARLDARQFTLAAADVDLDELVEACGEGFGPEAADAGVELNVATKPVRVRADPDRLAQVVANLVDNSLKYARGKIAVEAGPIADRARVSVQDDGPGIDAADLPHVFERLYVARHRPVRKESGSGLGLAIVRELVTAMGGTVGAEAGSLGGASLWFELPVLDLPSMSPDQGARPEIGDID